MGGNNQKLWTDEEIKFLQNHTHLKDKEIAKRLNRSIHSIRGKHRQYYVKYNASLRYSMDMDFFKVWSKEMAYILGFIFADGYIRSRRIKSELRLKIKDQELLKKMNSIMQSTYPIKVEKTSAGTFYILNICRNQVVEDLYKYGVVSKKSRTMEFPDIPQKYIFHFIRGYFDGDGNTGIVNNSLIIDFTSGSKKFIQKLKQILERYNIECSLYELKRKNTVYLLKILAKGKQLFFQLLYENASIFLERKYHIMRLYFLNIYPKLKIIKCLDCGITIEKKSNNHKRCVNCQSIAIKDSYKHYYYKNRERKLRKHEML